MRWYVKEAWSALGGLASFGAVLLIDTSLLYLAVGAGVGIAGYFGSRLLLPRTREAGALVVEQITEQATLSDAEITAQVVKNGRVYNDWLKGICSEIEKNTRSAQVVVKLTEIRQVIKAAHAHIEKDPYGVRTFAVTMGYYLETFEKSLKAYQNLVTSEYQNAAVAKGMNDFEAGLPDVHQAFDKVYSALIARKLDELQALQTEFAAVSQMNQAISR